MWVDRRRSRSSWLIIIPLLGVALAHCGDTPPTSPGSSAQDVGWFIFPVACGNCPGLTNVDIDRTVVPYRASLRVGQQTSLRAAASRGCAEYQDTLQVVEWMASVPGVIKVEPSSSESAIVTALAPGISRVTAKRQLSKGQSETWMGDPSLAQATACSALPEVVFSIR